jgi:hypothetical protein
VGLAGSAAGGGVFESVADFEVRQHAALHVEKKLAEVDAAGIKMARHASHSRSQRNSDNLR